MALLAATHCDKALVESGDEVDNRTRTDARWRVAWPYSSVRVTRRASLLA